jgi:hypothetical protein
VINISIADLVALGENGDLATTTNNTYITMMSSAFEDVSGRDVLAIVDGKAVQASDVVTDETAPVLVVSTLDLTSEQLVLNFSEPLNTSSFDSTGISLQSAANRTAGVEWHAIESTNVSFNAARDVFVVQLTADDLNAIKVADLLAVDDTSTFIVLSSSVGIDLGVVAVSTIVNHSAQAVDSVVFDSVSPEVESFGIDMDAGVLTLNFSEIVRGNTIVITEITLQDKASASAQFTLTGGDLVLVDNALTLHVNMTVDDLNKIKAASLANSASDTFLRFNSSMIKDMRGNNVSSIADSAAIEADDYLDDFTPPHLVSFDLNMNSATLKLQFSETVPPSSVEMTSFSVQSVANESAAGVVQFDLTGGNVSTAVISTEIVAELTKDDMDSIKALSALAVSNTTTFLVVGSDGVKDVSGNNVTAVVAAAATAVSVFTADTTSPELEYFTLDLDSGLMLASFSETVNGSSFDPSEMTVQSVSNGTEAGTLSHNLQGGWNVSTAASVNVSFVLLKDDADALKAVDGLATDASNTYVSLTSALVSDMSNNDVAAIEIVAGLVSSGLGADGTAPYVVQFTFDLNAGIINISMSEPVADSINVSALAFVSSGDTAGYALTVGSNATLADGQRRVEIAVSTLDLNELKARPSLATSTITTVLQLDGAFCSDKNENAVATLTLGDNKTASVFEDDTEAPTLSSFVLDLSADQLALTFSETVDGSTFNASGLTLVGVSSNAQYQLTGGFSDDSFSTVVVLNLTTIDINAIKRNPLLGVTVGNTYLSVATTTVADMSDLAVTEIIVAGAKQASDVVEDLVQPKLVEYSLDMDRLVLQMSFSEPVNVDVFDVTTLRFSAVRNASGDSVALSGGVLSVANMSVVNISLTVSDSNAIKADSGLCTNTSTTYLSFTNETVSDIFGNALAVPTLAVQAKEHTPDATAPVVSGAELDMNAGILTVNFTETVKASSLNASLIGFGSSTVSGALVTVDDDSVISTTDADQVTIQLSNDTLNALKLDARVATSNSDTVVVVAASGVLDMNLVEIAAQVVDGVDFVEDETDPELESFELDMHNGVISMTFTEAVNVDTFEVTELTLHGASTGGTKFTLTGGYVGSVNGTSLLVNLTVLDLNVIKQKEDLATSKFNTYMSVTTNLIKDMVNNEIASIATNNALQASDFYQDSRAATLLWLLLDMDAGIVTP